ncbi:MAG: prolyl oligopeptidase family serine peptidase [Opitutales bacterium]|nr:prolyl oligopeptidase family serine peptidase [Opitutales bacterium]
MKPSIITLISTLILSCATFISVAAIDDPYLWLEEVESEKALNWVRTQNDTTIGKISSVPNFEERKDQAMDILNASDRIALPSEMDERWIYNFWRDSVNPQGIWRKAEIAPYIEGNPEWITLIDFDELSEKDGIRWVYQGTYFDSSIKNRCLVEYSNGGKDAAFVKEFDLDKGIFVEEGFYLPEGKHRVTWINKDELYVGIDEGGDTVTESGYPRTISKLTREESLEDAKVVFEVSKSSVSATVEIFRDGQNSHTVFYDLISFFNSKKFLKGTDGNLIELQIPQTSSLEGMKDGQLIVQLKENWEIGSDNLTAGSLISFDIEELERAHEVRTPDLVFSPNKRQSIEAVDFLKSAVILTLNENVTGKLLKVKFDGKDWNSTPIETPPNGTLSITASSQVSDTFFLNFESFLIPDQLNAVSAKSGEIALIQSLPSKFDAENLVAKQFEAKSADGTMIPYFIVHAKDMKFNGENKTIISAYGGFEVSRNPFYLSVYGKLWSEPGNVFVLANIRGGGEFGPDWHRSAIKENRQRAFDDLHAVAEDLIQRKIASPSTLGIAGGSNGGLLVAVAFTQRPDLYGGVFCAVPLLDMLRYHELPPGASWISEYGDPRIPEEYEFIAAYSPYQNLEKEATYPKVFFYTSTKDDRVHPGHARKMAARMMEMKHPIYYFERIEGGHAGGANLDQYAELYALEFTYFEEELRK